MKTTENNKVKFQWYEIIRHDGTVQYARKYKDLFYLWGSGFGIEEFDAKAVNPIDEVPILHVKGYAYFDGGNKYKAITNENERWNGWALPLIHESEIDKLIQDITGDGIIIKKEGNNVILIEEEEGDILTSEPIVMFGDIYYDIGNGWCWNFDKEEDLL
jgi:predicted lipoprotein with Yx(FWY)xxD motif